MNPPLEIGRQHRQLHLMSCGAWGIELLLKVFDTIPLDSYPIQQGPTPERTGFSDADVELLRSHGLFVERHHRAAEYLEFERLIDQRLKDGWAVIFVVPSMVYFDIEKSEVSFACHSFTAGHDNGVLRFATWNYHTGRPNVILKESMTVIHGEWLSLAKHYPKLEDSLLNSLFVRRETADSETEQPLPPSAPLDLTKSSSSP
jgi:hypothetical protein